MIKPDSRGKTDFGKASLGPLQGYYIIYLNDKVFEDFTNPGSTYG